MARSRQVWSFHPRLEGLEVRTLLSPGVLDPTFGTGGKVFTDFGGGQDEARTVLIQPDRKIVVLGSTRTASGNGSRFALARYNPDGSLDATFGSGGKVTTTFGPDPGGAAATAAALQGDGKIVVVGAGPSQPLGPRPPLVMARYNPDGSLDATFGTGGEVNGDMAGESVVLQPDGKILVAESATSFNTCSFANALARFYPDGRPDTTFGNGGTVQLNVDPSDSCGPAGGLALQADGTIMVRINRSLGRFHPDGSPDNGFGNGGRVTMTGEGGLALQRDGKILVVGSGLGNDFVHFSLARFNPNGAIDATFGKNGLAVIDLGMSGGSISTLTVQPDGRIVVAGSALDQATNTGSFIAARFNPNGSLDSTFGSGGQVRTPLGSGTVTASGIILQPDGRIVVAGTAFNGSDTDFVLARYLGDDAVPDLNQRFLARVYLDLLQRPVDAGGLMFWTGLLNQGASRAQVSLAIESSQEYVTLLVQALYGLYLNRGADPGGLNAFVVFLGSGGTVAQAKAVMLGSAEYFGRAGNNNNGFLGFLYRDALGRMIDPSGQSTFSQALAQGAPRSAVASAILTSPEGEQDIVQALYFRFLRRPADRGGLSSFVVLLQNGISEQAVTAAILGSTEYIARP